MSMIVACSPSLRALEYERARRVAEDQRAAAAWTRAP
jgi:hypothetical protein